MQIVLIRPGATQYSEQGRIAGNLELPLSETGQAEVQTLIPQARALQLTVIYSTEEGVEAQTAKLISDALNIKHKTLPELANLDHGLWQGMLIDEICEKQSKVSKQWQEHAESICPPGGEMLEEAMVRIEDALDRIVRKNAQGVVGIVIQEPLASVMRHRLLGTDYGDLWEATANQPVLETIEVHSTQWRMTNSLTLPSLIPRQEK